VSRGKKNRRLPDLSLTPDEWQAIKDREEAQRQGEAMATPRPALARRPRSRPVTSSRLLTDEQVQRYRSGWVDGIAREHRKPWQGPVLDLIDLPCICTRNRACALHAYELGGPRPFARP
jgi:hypothetical protein